MNAAGDVDDCKYAERGEYEGPWKNSAIYQFRQLQKKACSNCAGSLLSQTNSETDTDWHNQ